MIIALTGPSGVGKGYIKKKLLRLYPFIEELAWFTTRQLRSNESVGGNRISVSEPEFNKLVESGELALVQNLFGNYYGIRKNDLIPNPNVRLTELHINNVSKALRINPAILVIGLINNDISLLRERLLIDRHTESPAEIEKRIEAGIFEMESILRQQSLFLSVIEMPRSSEIGFIKIIEILSPYLSQKEGG